MNCANLTRVGIFGAGQLGKMLAIAGSNLGLEIVLFSEEATPCAASVAKHIVGTLADREQIKNFAEQCCCVTSEFENIPAEVLETAAEVTAVYPQPGNFHLAQDRLLEKQLAVELSIPTAEFLPIDSRSSLESAYKKIAPHTAILKTRKFGYDGKGQYQITSSSDLEAAWGTIQSASILERRLKFDRELSVIAVRSRSGECKFYDLVENTHRQAILVHSRVARKDPLQQQAEVIGKKLLNQLNYVGVLVIELFQLGNQLYLNELAPRVHNSGHWTIEGAATSQFENHLRAILDLPLGATDTLFKHVELFNILSVHPSLSAILSIPKTHLHIYGKQQRVGRKLGHITIAQNQDPTPQIVQLRKLLQIN